LRANELCKLHRESAVGRIPCFAIRDVLAAPLVDNPVRRIDLCR
jgi:hypothetical protein